MSESQKDFHKNGRRVIAQYNEPTGLSYGKWLTIVDLTHMNSYIRQYCKSKTCQNLEISMYIN